MKVYFSCPGSAWACHVGVALPHLGVTLGLSHAQALPGYAVWWWLCHTWGWRSQAEPGNEGINFGV